MKTAILCLILLGVASGLQLSQIRKYNVKERAAHMRESLNRVKRAWRYRPYKPVLSRHQRGRSHRVTLKISPRMRVFDMIEAGLKKAPTLPPLPSVFSKSELRETFDQKGLHDVEVVKMITEAATKKGAIFDVINGASSFRDMKLEDIRQVPPKLLKGFDKSKVQEMTSNQMAILLDSDEYGKDPTSMKKILDKSGDKQFKDTLAILTRKMEAGTKDWRPPASVQDVVSEHFMKLNRGQTRWTGDEFAEKMCPFVAGIKPSWIKSIPRDDNSMDRIMQCMDKSYLDLDTQQRKQFSKWVNDAWKKGGINTENAIRMQNFILDLPLGQLQRATSLDVKKFVLAGGLDHLDTSHKNFYNFAKFIVKTAKKSDPSIFNDTGFMDKLGRARCVVHLKDIKNIFDTARVKKFLDFNMHHCKDRFSDLVETFEKCKNGTGSRLKRCANLEKQIKMEKRKREPPRQKKVRSRPKRMDLKEYKMMKDVVDVFLTDKNITNLDATGVREIAGALGALKPKDIDKIPPAAILENLDAIKNNTLLTKRQKKKLFKKMKTAGLDVTSTSLSSLGELVSGVPAKEFKRLSVDRLKEDLSEIKKHAGSLSPAQKRAIMAKLNEGSVSDLLDADLGDLAAEIPLSELDQLESIDMEKVKKKHWRRGQARNLIKKYRETRGTENTSLKAEDIRTMGFAAVGLTCKDVIDMQDEDVYDAALAISEETHDTLPVDMDECVSSRLHYSLQVMKGVEYISNASDPELEETLSYIPGDVAMMLPVDDLRQVPSDACEALMQNIGEADLELLPSGVGDVTREELAEISMNCVNAISSSKNPLDDHLLPVVGKLMCDLGPEDWGKFTDETFATALPTLQGCFDRLHADQAGYLDQFASSYYGSDARTWTEDALTSLGPLVSILDKPIIQQLDEGLVYEYLDDISPPEISKDDIVYDNVNYDAFYAKTADAVLAQREPEVARRRRSVTAPTYDEIVVLGPGNVAWSVQELEAISDTDFENAFGTLGGISAWSTEQARALIVKAKSRFGATDSWSAQNIADAGNLISYMDLDDVSDLKVTDIDTVVALSEVDMSSERRIAVVASYVTEAGADYRTMSGDDLASFGDLVCGVSTSNLVALPVESVQTAVKDLGQVECFSQEQFDILTRLAMMGKGSFVPTAAQLDEMGTLAAGLTASDLSGIPTDAMAFISPNALLLISTTRLKDGLSEDQIMASGILNVAALMTPSIFNSLSPSQRNALRTTVDGEDAVLEDVPTSEDTASSSSSSASDSDDKDVEEEDAANDIAMFADDDEEEIALEDDAETPTAGAPSAISGNTIHVSLLSLVMLLLVNIVA